MWLQPISDVTEFEIHALLECTEKLLCILLAVTPKRGFQLPNSLQERVWCQNGPFAGPEDTKEGLDVVTEVNARRVRGIIIIDGAAFTLHHGDGCLQHAEALTRGLSLKRPEHVLIRERS